ncbi:MAG TPA: sodium:proton antiporter [Gammaproteobacteria bacterium]|nr:sodium:proton antiporter [Gammaproteobacteria bacterium]
MQRFTSALFLLGLGLLITAIFQHMDFTGTLPIAGDAINAAAAQQTGAANFVTAVVLGYRGFDTLLELTILFTAATAGGLVLGKPRAGAKHDPQAGFILRAGADLFFPLLLVVGLYIIVHGHLTPGGGFQGGVILAVAFFLPLLARPGTPMSHKAVSLIEGLAGASFILIGLLAMFGGEAFLTPMLDKGQPGELLSAGSLPLLYIAVGLKVGSELAGLLAHMAATEASDA